MSKLVRDGLVEEIRRDEGRRVVDVAEVGEYEGLLSKKLVEEATEWAVDRDVRELADCLEVLHAIVGHMGIPWAEVERLRQLKREQRGGYEGRHVLR